MRERALAVFALAGLVAGAVLWLVGEPTGPTSRGASEPRWCSSPWPSTRRGASSMATSASTRSRSSRSPARSSSASSSAAAIVALMLSGGAALEAWAAGGRGASSGSWSTARRGSRTVAGRRAVEQLAVEDARGRRSRCSCARARSFPPTASSQRTEAVVDESALTGEPLPVDAPAASRCAAARRTPATPSSCARPRRGRAAPTPRSCGWCSEAERRSAPFVADWPTATPRFFLPFTLVVAGACLGGLRAIRCARSRCVVVATPCPLILAAPIALRVRASRARRGAAIIVKGGGRARALGKRADGAARQDRHVTHGSPEIERVVPTEGLDADETLRLAASLDQLSAHVVAESLVRGARARASPCEVADRGRGGSRQRHRGPRRRGHRVAVGSAGWLESRGYALDSASGLADNDAGRGTVLVGVDGRLEGRDRCP